MHLLYQYMYMYIYIFTVVGLVYGVFSSQHLASYDLPISISSGYLKKTRSRYNFGKRVFCTFKCRFENCKERAFNHSKYVYISFFILQSKSLFKVRAFRRWKNIFLFEDRFFGQKSLA